MIVENFLLVGKSSSWGLLSTEKRLQEPQSERCAKAWNVLCQQVPPGGKEADLRPATRCLLEPPYGYDANTLSLLFCAWFGYHRHDLSLSIGGQQSTTEELVQEVDRGPAKFVEFLTAAGGSIRLSRRDRSGAAKEVKEIAQRAERLAEEPYSKVEAREAVAKLDGFLVDERNPETEKKQALEVKSILQTALQQVAKYDSDAASLLGEAARSKDVPSLVVLVGKVGALQPCNGIVSTQPRIDQMRGKLQERLAAAVDEFSLMHEVLPDLTHYEAYRQQLQGVHEALGDFGDLRDRVAAALQTLDLAKEKLQSKERDAATIGLLDMVAATGPLAQLRSSLARTEKMPCLSDETTSVRAKKIEDLTRAINELVEFSARARALADGVDSVQQLRQVQAALSERRLLFGDTVELEQIAVADRVCAGLEGLFQDLGRLRPDAFTTKKEYAELSTELDELPNRYAEAAGETLERAIDRTRSRMMSRVSELEQQAAKWLDRATADARRPDKLSGMLQQLASPPEFLPDGKRSKVEELRVEVNRQIEQARLEEDQRRQDEATLGVLRAMSAGGLLAELRSNLELLGQMRFTTQKAQAEQAKKMELTQKAVGGLAEFAEGLPAKLDAVTTGVNLGKLKTGILERKMMFKGSPEAAPIEAAMERCDLIASFLNDVSRLQSAGFENQHQYDAVVAKAKELKDAYAGRVSRSQAKLLEDAKASAIARLRSLEAKAEEWLSKAQGRFSKGSGLDRLLDDLRTPPPFLKDSKQGELDGLLAAVDTAVAKDLSGQIQRLFKKISDTSIRKQIVEELRALLQE